MIQSLSCRLTNNMTMACADGGRTGRFYHGLANVKLGQGMEQESFEYLERAREYVSGVIL
jgi:hypothetical protein